MSESFVRKRGGRLRQLSNYEINRVLKHKGIDKRAVKAFLMYLHHYKFAGNANNYIDGLYRSKMLDRKTHQAMSRGIGVSVRKAVPMRQGEINVLSETVKPVSESRAGTSNIILEYTNMLKRKDEFEKKLREYSEMKSMEQSKKVGETIGKGRHILKMIGKSTYIRPDQTKASIARSSKRTDEELLEELKRKRTGLLKEKIGLKAKETLAKEQLEKEVNKSGSKRGGECRNKRRRIPKRPFRRIFRLH